MLNFYWSKKWIQS